MAKNDVDYDIFSAMQTEDPKTSFKKVCIGKILVKVLNPFSGEVEEKVLSGDPFNSTTDLDNIVIDIWTDKDAVFFRKANKYHFEHGNLVEFSKEELKREELSKKNYNTLTDTEINQALNDKFFTLKSILEKTNTTTVLMRFLNMAREQEKSEKIIKTIEQRLAEIQMDLPNITK